METQDDGNHVADEIDKLLEVVEAAAAIDEVGADAGCRLRLAIMARKALSPNVDRFNGRRAFAEPVLNDGLGVWIRVKDSFPPKDKKIIAHWPETLRQASMEAFVFYSEDTGVWYMQNRGFAGNAEAPSFEWWLQLPATNVKLTSRPAPTERTE